MSDNGKGDTQRPILVDRKVYEDNWQRTFGRKATKEEIDDLLADLPQEVMDKIAAAYKKIDDITISIKEKQNASE